jgi:hypothetical protein
LNKLFFTAKWQRVCLRRNATEDNTLSVTEQTVLHLDGQRTLNEETLACINPSTLYNKFIPQREHRVPPFGRKIIEYFNGGIEMSIQNILD